MSISNKTLLTLRDRKGTPGISVNEQVTRYIQWAIDNDIKQVHVFDASKTGKRAQDTARAEVIGILSRRGVYVGAVSTDDYGSV